MKSMFGIVASVMVAALAVGCGETIADPDFSFQNDGTEIQAKKVAGGQQTGGRPLSADLTGAAEFPGPGDPDGSGSADVTLNQGQGEVCFDIQVADVDPIMFGHIHVGVAGMAGGVVVDLDVPNNGLNGCVDADRATIKAIRRNPAGYYVNLHNPTFPAGALRGQLTK